MAPGVAVSGAEEVLQSAMLAAVAADAGVQANLGDPLRIEEASGPRPAFPYLELVRHDSAPAGATGVEASTHLVDLAVVSRLASGREAVAAMSEVRRALGEAELVMEGWRCVLLVPVFFGAARTRPGLWRATLRVKAVVEKVET